MPSGQGRPLCIGSWTISLLLDWIPLSQVLEQTLHSLQPPIKQWTGSLGIGEAGQATSKSSSDICSPSVSAAGAIVTFGTLPPTKSYSILLMNQISKMSNVFNVNVQFYSKRRWSVFAVTILEPLCIIIQLLTLDSSKHHMLINIAALISVLIMWCYITNSLDASDTGHFVNATLWKLCLWTAEEV